MKTLTQLITLVLLIFFALKCSEKTSPTTSFDDEYKKLSIEDIKSEYRIVDSLNVLSRNNELDPDKIDRYVILGIDSRNGKLLLRICDEGRLFGCILIRNVFSLFYDKCDSNCCKDINGVPVIDHQGIVGTPKYIGCSPDTSQVFDSNDESQNEKEKFSEGLCIYPTQAGYTSDLSYQTINPEKVSINGVPIIYYDEIITYDTTSHILSLTYPIDSIKVRIGNIGVYGKPFVVALDSLKIYGGWFWTPISSIPCHWVVIELDALFDTLATDEIRIKLGYPNEEHFIGEDPRNNHQIFDRLIRDGKMK